MIRPAALILATLAAVSAPFAAAAAERRFAVSGFDRVGVSGADNVTIRTGNTFSVVATGAQEVLDKLEIDVENGQLRIGRKQRGWSWGGKGATIAVTMPALRGLAASGSADVRADKGAADSFDVRVSGSGNVDLASLDAKTTNVSVSGSGDVRMAGRCGAQNVKVVGSGNVDLSALNCVNSAISVAGSGDVMARVTGQAAVSVAGSGDVTITGGGNCTKKVAGSGEVRCS